MPRRKEVFYLGAKRLKYFSKQEIDYLSSELEQAGTVEQVKILKNPKSVPVSLEQTFSPKSWK